MYHIRNMINIHGEIVDTALGKVLGAFEEAKQPVDALLSGIGFSIETTPSNRKRKTLNIQGF